MGTGGELISLFDAVYSSIVDRLRQESDWLGFLVTDSSNDFKYERLNYKYDLRVRNEKVYKVGINLFLNNEVATEWHNHRFPFLIYPIALSGSLESPVYKMDWEDKASGEAGTTMVISGECYSIQRCADVFHRVMSLCDHASINIADITEPPVRPDRLTSQKLSSPRTAEILEILRTAIKTPHSCPPDPAVRIASAAALSGAICLKSR
ncbi:MAG: hypothetical protein EHM38_03895 [Geobacteraceae bacterium]|nr:MAG: hypothetical protein EHM38_03895 [Geobacteraceae bacterium]